jgi:hypothetical protein
VKIRLARVVAVGLVALLLAACEGEVTKKDADRNGAPHLLVVDDSGKERWVKVDRDTFESCKFGEWYEDGKCSPKPTGERNKDIARGERNIPLDDDGKRLEDADIDELILVTVNLSSTAKGGIMSYYCQGNAEEIHETMESRSFHKRCLLRRGQRVTVTGAARGAGWECNMTILGGTVEVDSDVGMNSVRCSWVADR